MSWKNFRYPKGSSIKDVRREAERGLRPMRTKADNGSGWIHRTTDARMRPGTGRQIQVSHRP